LILAVRLKRTLILLILTLLALSTMVPYHPASPVPNPVSPKAELRAFWVDGFHQGIRSLEDQERLVAEAKRANINVLIVQVRRRADSFYLKSFEPPVEDPAYDPKFDALENIIKLAHREGIEVHAWINAMPVWSKLTPPRDERHVFNRQKLWLKKNTWLTLTLEGRNWFPVGCFLDPGHPLAAQYIADVCLNVIRNYAVDGIHLDYIRYPETRDKVSHGATVGYNPTSLQRFRIITKRKDIPAPNDEQWIAWRRQQVTQLVRRIYIEAKAVNPRIKVSAATVAWGKPPRDDKDFLESLAGQTVFQDWNGWMKEGIIDMVVPTNYARETDPTTKAWFDGWVRWEKEHKYGRQLAIGLGNYLNRPEATIAQVERVRNAENQVAADGLALYSYATPVAISSLSKASVPSTAPATHDLIKYLVQGPGTAPGPFRDAAPIPRMDWVESPKTGSLAGVVRGSNGNPVDGATVVLRHAGSGSFREMQRTTSDGTGYFGFTNLAPGPYEVQLEKGTPTQTIAADVQVARVSRLEIKEP
jgi:uncharacterized lipoprotein YddW (UPF0748 family)